MIKTHFNDAIIGNSKMLACLTSKGELIRLFWPHIDYPQHIERMAAGIFYTGHKNSTSWLNGCDWHHKQYYVEHTNILKTICQSNQKGLRIEQIDFALIDKDILVRQYTIENTGYDKVDLGFMQYSSMISTNPELLSTLFDFNADSLIHYRHNYYTSISSEREVVQFQLGNNAFDSAASTELNGYDSIGMMNEGAISFNIGEINPGQKVNFNLFICLSHTLKGVKELARSCRQMDVGKEYENTASYWKEVIKDSRQLYTKDNDINELYKRTILVFKLMSDKRTGGLLASAEVDEGFTRCGRYAYCWGRDAAFITEALDTAGLTDAVDMFYKWAVMTQDEDGSWQQRFYMDGNLAPSWGLQVDETGSLIWGMYSHYRATDNIDFLRDMWESIEKGVEFLIRFKDEDTGLPKPSYDLWEERVGEHTYSSAAVYGGLKAGVEVARIMNANPDTIERWSRAATEMKEAIEKNFWKDEANRFIRSVRTKLNPWGSEHSQHTVIIKANDKGYYRDVTLEDWIIDVSLIGVTVPFKVFDAKDTRVRQTVEAIENALTSHPVGGIKRYEHDNYMGGNPWVLATLWVALYYIEIAEYDKAKEYLMWAVKSRTQLGFLPEQVSKDSGKPCWVIPLTWSHAMFVLVLSGLKDAGAL
ncbi:MAG: glycoside hydrolase [Clostridium sp.]|nr:glycoside hydrolase [Clostridium sp.]